MMHTNVYCTGFRYGLDCETEESWFTWAPSATLMQVKLSRRDYSDSAGRALNGYGRTLLNTKHTHVELDNVCRFPKSNR